MEHHTSGAIHGNVPTSDMFVVFAKKREVPKSQSYRQERNIIIIGRVVGIGSRTIC